MKTPLVSVVMPVFNGAAFIGEAIQSVLDQTIDDFELLIIDDGSRDETLRIARSFVDARIRILANPTNIGVGASSNRAMNAARGVFIARLDADDLCLPERFARQVAFLEARREIGLCGSAVEIFGQGPTAVRWFPCEPDEIACRMVFTCPFSHSSVMMRTASLRKANLLYREKMPYAEDWEFWSRCSRHFSMMNMAEVLVRYRLHGNNASIRPRSDCQKYDNLVRGPMLADLGITPSEDDYETHTALAHMSDVDRLRPETAARWIEVLSKGNQRFRRFPADAFARELSTRWLEYCVRSAPTKVGRIFRVIRSRAAIGAMGVYFRRRRRPDLYKGVV